MSSVRVQGVSRRFGEVVALDGVDLDMAAGTRTAIVGPSGSGKTTLLRILAGFEFPDAGTVTLDARRLVDGPGGVPAHQRGIGYVPQDGALFPHLDVAANIGFGLNDTRVGQARRVAELAAMVSLDEVLLKRWPHELSGGQQQRVALARALAQQPRLMLLDEPFSALDTGLRASLRSTVTQVLGEAGITSVLVTHDQDEALSFAQHLAVMRQGRLVQAGRPQALYRRPCDAQTASFLGEAVIVPATLSGGWAQCALGAVALEVTTNRHEGVLVLRPEHLQLLAPEDAAGALATVVSSEYAGNHCALVLRVGPDIAPFTLRAPADTDLAPGATVRLGVLGSAHLLP